jgi:hypothetical protein
MINDARLTCWSNAASNFAVDRTAGSHSLAAAAHRERWADETALHPVNVQSARPRMARDKPLR